jgi:tetratricopeptide (TPR) repeat protein
MPRTIACLAFATLLPALVLGGGTLEQARQRIDDGDYEAARRLLEPATSDPALEAEALVLLAEAYSKSGDFESGARTGKRAIAAAPDSSAAHFQYAYALRIKMSNVGRLKAMFSLGAYKRAIKRAIELDPRNVAARQEEIGYLMYAPSIAGGSIERARQRVDALRPIDWRAATIALAEVESQDKNPEAAIEAYGRVLEKDTDDSSCRLDLAFLLQRLERFREADRHFARLADDPDPYYALTGLYQRARSRILGTYEPELATQYLLSYIAKRPDEQRGVPSRSNAYWRLGNAYEQLARRDDARRAYRRALDLDRDNKSARMALEQLNSG